MRINHADHPTVSIPARGRMIPADPAAGAMEKFDAGMIHDLANPRAMQCEIEWDGTVNARLQATLTGQDIGTGEVSLVWKGRLSSAAAEQWLIATGPATTELMGGAGGFGIFKTAAGHLHAGIHATAGYEYRRVANAVTLLGDREVIIIATRSGSTLKIYIDAVDTAHTAGDTTTPMIAASITTTFLAINLRGINYSAGYRGSFSRGWIANCALSQDDAIEIQRIGGRVPFRYRFGSQALLNAGSFANDTNPAKDYDSFSGASATGFTAVKSGTSQEANAYSGTDFAAYGGKVFALSCNVTHNSGTLPFVYISAAAGSPLSNAAIRLTAGAHSQTIAVTTNPGALTQRLRFYNALAEVVDYAVSGISFRQIGALCYLDADNGGYGFTLPDESSNGLHATFPVTTGWAWSRNTKLVGQSTDGYADNTAGPFAITIPNNTFGDLLLVATQSGIGESYWRVPYVKLGGTLALGTAAKAIRSGDPISSVSISSNNVSVTLVAANTFLKFKLVDVRWF